MKRNLKQIVYSFSAIVLVISATSCKKSFLEANPEAIYTPQNTYNSAAGLMAAVEAAGKNIWYENQCASSNTDPYDAQMFFSDEGVSGATDATSSKNFAQTLTPDATDVTGWYYTNLYSGVKYANTVITYIDVPKWDTTQTTQRTQRNSILGMGYFWRSYYYYDLVNCYGDVPWVGSLASTPITNFYSTARLTILKKIQQDLQYAVTWVPDGGAKGLLTKGAAENLLAKVDLELGDFADAITVSSSLINGGVYKLMTNRFGSSATDPTKNVIYDLHQPLNKSLPANTEGMLMAINREGVVGNIGPDYWIRNEGPYWGHNIVTPNGNTGTSDAVGIAIDQNSAYGRGVAFIRLSWYGQQMIWGSGTNSNNDYRHAEGTWMRMTDFVYNAPSLLTLKTNNVVTPDPYYGKPLQKYSAAGKILVSDTIRSWFDYPGYKVFVYDPNTAASTQYGGYSDAYLMRLAETYLVRAEAYIWSGQSGLALADINTIRTRANAAPLTGTPTIATVLDERARELEFEEERKIELTRISYIFAQTGQTAPTGKSYNIAGFATSNFWYDWIMSKTDFYNKNVVAPNGISYTMSPYMVLWPVPTTALTGNTTGHINQNIGYTGAGSNIAPLTTIQ